MTIFKSAKLNGKIKNHPLDGVKFSKSKKAVDDLKVLTVEEQRKFLEAAKRSHNYYQYAFLLETGLRTGEMIALTWDDIGLDKRKDQQRKKRFNMKGLVFINFRTGMPGKNSSYDTHLYKLCDEAGIRRFSMHTLRHTYATRAIESGMPPKTLQKLLGHASLKG